MSDPKGDSVGLADEHAFASSLGLDLEGPAAGGAAPSAARPGGPAEAAPSSRSVRSSSAAPGAGPTFPGPASAASAASTPPTSPTSPTSMGGPSASPASAPSRPWVGKSLGHFKLLELIGEGTMGVVIRALDVNLGRLVALKVLRRRIEGMDEGQRVTQFLREARAAARIDHPCVVTIFEINEHRGWWYIASELVEGGSLHGLVRRAGPLPPARACALVADAASALAAAHSLGVVHRDVKPQNLLLARNGRCKVIDFGLVRLHDPADPFDFTTRVVGTPLYVAPEVLRRHEATGASDVYGLGGTLHFALTGEPPFAGFGPKELARMHVDAERPDVRRQRPECPERIALLVQRAMAIDPAARPTAEELEAALRVETIGELGEPAPRSLAPFPSHDAVRELLRDPLERSAGERSSSGTAASALAADPALVGPGDPKMHRPRPRWLLVRRGRTLLWGAVVALVALVATVGLNHWRQRATDVAPRVAASPEQFQARFPDAPASYGSSVRLPAAPPRWGWVGRVEPDGGAFVGHRGGRKGFPTDHALSPLIAADSVIFFKDEEAVRGEGRTVAPRHQRD